MDINEVLQGLVATLGGGNPPPSLADTNQVTYEPAGMATGVSTLSQFPQFQGDLNAPSTFAAYQPK